MTLPRQSPARPVRTFLQKERHRTAIFSISAALVLVLLLTLVLAWISLKSMIENSPTLLVTTHPPTEYKKEEKTKVRVSTSKTLGSPPSPRMPRLIAAKIPNAISVPVQEITGDSLSFNLGIEDGFGEGWGVNLANNLIKERPDIVKNPDVNLARSGSATFLGQTVQTGRLVYVIEMGAELSGSEARWNYAMVRDFAKTIRRMESNQMLVGTIFFGGPAFSIGDTVELTMSEEYELSLANKTYNLAASENTISALVRTPDEYEFFWTRKRESRTAWEPHGRKQKIPWYEMTQTTKSWFLEVLPLTRVRSPTNGPLYRDTHASIWNNALNMALEMSPPPEQIVFVVASASLAPNVPGIWVDEIGPKAKEMGVKINCLGIIAPQLESHLSRLSRMTGGQCRMLSRSQMQQRQYLPNE